MSLHRALVIGLIGLVSLGCVLLILSIWGVVFDGEILFKMLATIGILVVLLGFLLVVKSDFGEHKRLKDENFID
jgi:hypothetical protein